VTRSHRAQQSGVSRTCSEAHRAQQCVSQTRCSVKRSGTVHR